MPISKEVLQKYPNKVFVETGTLFGDTVQVALDCGFEKILTIELNPKRVEMVKQRFAKEISDGIIEIFQGDVANEFPSMVDRVKDKATFWLDAHWDDGPMGKYKCPLPFELETILNSGIKTHTILIDDRRIFGGGNWGQGISEASLIKQLKQINSEYVISTDHGVIPDDILVAKIGKKYTEEDMLKEFLS